MRALTSTELLDLWQEGSRQSPLERALHLVGAACDVNSIQEIARLSIGERDLRLLQLREWLFGTQLHNLVNCPVCTGVCEWEGDLNALRMQTHRRDDIERRYEYVTDGYHLYYRLPNSEDLYGTKDEKKILIDCILTVDGEQGPCLPDDCPSGVLEKLALQIEQEDPQADIRFNVHCPTCDHQWETNFDMGSYLWAEIDNWARHTLDEIYTLASHFGWSEHTILSMSSRRRQLYVQLIRS
jgi:hypothetical protein